jgi:Uma2 family endonuclease
MAHVLTASWAEAVPDTALMSAEQLVALPDDKRRYELIRGRLVRQPLPDLRRHLLVADLVRLLNGALGTDAAGGASFAETRFLVSGSDDEQTVLIPAVAVVGPERLPDAQTTEGVGYVRAVPDLVVEIASPGQQRAALAEKVALWLESGVRLAWVIWPSRRQVDVWRAGRADQPSATLSAHDVLDGDDVAPGFTSLVAHLFI